MARNITLPGRSPSAIASNWLDDQLVAVLASVRRRLRRQVMLASLGPAFVSGIGAFSLSSWGGTAGNWAMPGALGATVLAVIASLMGAASLYPVLHQREHWLLRAVSIITHDHIDLLSVLGKLTELRSGETAGHNLRVTVTALLFAESLKLPPEDIVRIVKGALLHDVGKLVVPDRILASAKLLTPDEHTEMATHVRYGQEIISQSKVLQDAAPLVCAHHERYDGTGYPLGLKGEAIPREARLFALVDVFDALTSSRVYKPAYDVEEALATMAAARGSHFDPVLFDRFVELAPDFARRLPQDESTLVTLLMDRLCPYVDLLVFERAMPSSVTPPSSPVGAGKP